MRRTAARWLVVLLALSPLGAVVGRARPAPPEDRAAAREWQGVTSCAAAACHNANGPAGSKGSEYTTWITLDPHARAVEVLYNDRSRGIIERLKEKQPAPENVRCLCCHVHPGIETAVHNRRFSREDGVGCESCHGPAEKWLATHYLPDQRGRRDTAGTGDAPANLKDLRVRAETCVPCHVGGPAGDVNHDLIAAGHPRLAFEFSAYLANLPRHWPVAGEEARPDFDVRAWEVGQDVCAAAALGLLQARAANQNGPWPELAEYDCFACHHGLDPRGRRQTEEYLDGRKPGSLPWRSWYLSGAFKLLNPEPDPARPHLEEALAMPVPDRDRVTELARGATRQIRIPAAGTGPERAAAVRQRYERLRDLAREAVQSRPWDDAAQLYLALAAHHASLKNLDSTYPAPAEEAFLRSLVETLRFPKGFDSPKPADQLPGRP